MKLDAMFFSRITDPTRKLKITIRGNESGYKERWALKMHPDPDAQVDENGDILPKTTGVYLASPKGEARRHYIRLKGKNMARVAGLES